MAAMIRACNGGRSDLAAMIGACNGGRSDLAAMICAPIRRWVPMAGMARVRKRGHVHVAPMRGVLRGE